MSRIDFEANLPHVVLKLLDNKGVLVAPEAMFTDLIAGRLQESDIDGWEDTRNAIIHEWLTRLHEEASDE